MLIHLFNASVCLMMCYGKGIYEYEMDDEMLVCDVGDNTYV